MKIGSVDIRVNRIIRYLILGDLIVEGAFGLISPIFAIFIIERIVGGTSFTAGLAQAIYLLSFSLVRVPVAVYLDKKEGEGDEFWAMFLGFLVWSLVPFGYIFCRFPWQVYILQAIQGISIATAYAGYMSVFTTHIDHKEKATEWGIDASAVGIATGLTAAIGGTLAANFGFNLVFLLAGTFGLIGSLAIFALRKNFLHAGK